MSNDMNHSTLDSLTACADHLEFARDHLLRAANQLTGGDGAQQLAHMLLLQKLTELGNLKTVMHQIAKAAAVRVSGDTGAM